MSDIRLKKITVEPSNNPLIIQNGNISITDSTTSVNILTGALNVAGGVAINCSYDSVSSTSGGALSIGGGIAINKKAYLGGNFTLDNSTSTFTINGSVTNRLFLDSSSNKNFYISPDGITKRFDLYDTYLIMNMTKGSTNATSGAVVVNGGISINSTFDSVNSSNGGALTVSGGAAFGGNVLTSKSLTIGQDYSNNTGLLVRYTGNSQIALQNSSESNTSTINMIGDDLYISNNKNMYFYSTGGNFIFNNSSTGYTLLTITNSNSVFSKWVSITDTIESLNSTTGSLVVKGGVSIGCSTDALSSTSGGGVTVVGGLSVSRKIYTGDSIGVQLNANKNNKLMLYQASSDLTQNHQFSGFGIGGSGSMRLQLPSVSNDYILYAATSSTSSNEVFRIKGTNEVQFIGNAQRYSVLAGGYDNNSLCIQSQNAGTAMSFGYFTKDGNTTSDNDLKLFGNGLPNSVTNSEYLKIGWNASSSNYILSTNQSGSGINRILVLQSGISNQIILSTDGSTIMSSTSASINSSVGALVLLSGGVSINSTVTAASISQGGALTIKGGLSVAQNAYVGTTLNINANNSNGNIQLFSQNTTGTLAILSPNSNFVLSGITASNTYASTWSLYSLNNETSGNYELLNVACTNTTGSGIWNINSKKDGSGILRPIQINVGNFTQLALNTNGNIGINTTVPAYSFDINGNMNVNEYSYINGLQIYDTDNAFNAVSTGSLYTKGGATVDKNLRVNGLVAITNTTPSSNTQGALTIAGGVTIQSGQSSNYGQGALTVNGGGYFGGELYVEQNLNVHGQINGSGSSSSTFAYLTLTATDEAINLSTGTLVTFGGITLECYTNSSSVSNGGSILTPGGASIGQDVYIGGNVFNYGYSNYYVATNNILNFYDISNIQRFSIDRDIISNNLSISRYNSLGAFVEKSLDISNPNGMITLNNTTNSLNETTGALILAGGITINSTTDANDLHNGGGLSVAGGTSIAKRLFVGGDSVFSSTTVSTSCSDGSAIFHGGVGISGNLNVLGNTIITGNLTIVGTSTSVQSTNTLLKDNIIILNAGPAGSKDSGFLIQRYQYDNDTATGDVIADTAYLRDTLPNQSGMTSTQIKLSTNASSTDDAYTGWWITVTSGFSSNQTRKILGYVGATRIAVLSSEFSNQNPSLGDTVSLYNKPFVGIIYSETNDRFEFGSTVQELGSTTQFSDTLPIYFSSASSTSTQPSSSFTTGGIVATGGISSYCTSDATGISSGGALSVAGGACIKKSLYVGNNVFIGGVNITPNSSDTPSTVTFIAANNVSSPTDITGLLFSNSVWGFDIFLSVQIIATTNMYSNYQIRGVNKGSTWDLITSYVGDQTVTFSITNSGQIQYTTTNFAGFVSATFKYKVVTN
jgi:hypothetical protein